jgi:hypothetical protein
VSAPIYANLAEYRDWLEDQTAEVSPALFARASEVIDEVLIGALYAINDDTQLPTATAIMDALRDATCAQVQYMAAVGDTTGTGTTTSWGNIKIGSVALSEKKVLTPAPMKTVTGADVAAAALRPLRVAGLLVRTPWVLG